MLDCYAVQPLMQTVLNHLLLNLLCLIYLIERIHCGYSATYVGIAHVVPLMLLLHAWQAFYRLTYFNWDGEKKIF